MLEGARLTKCSRSIMAPKAERASRLEQRGRLGVGVDTESEGGVGVPGPRRNHRQRHPAERHERECRMTEVVKPDRAKA